MISVMSTHEPGIEMDYVNPGTDKLNEVLSGHYHSIVDKVRMLAVVQAALIQEGLFSDDSLEAIMGPCSAEADKTLAVLKNLPRTTKGLYTFVNIILTHYPHVAGPLKEDLDAVCLKSNLPTPVSEGTDSTYVKSVHGSVMSDDTAVKTSYPQQPERDNTDLKISNDSTSTDIPTELDPIQKMIADQFKLFSAVIEQKVEERLAEHKVELDLEKAREEEKRVAEQQKWAEETRKWKKAYKNAQLQLQFSKKQLENTQKELKDTKTLNALLMEKLDKNHDTNQEREVIISQLQKRIENFETTERQQKKASRRGQQSQGILHLQLCRCFSGGNASSESLASMPGDRVIRELESLQND